MLFSVASIDLTTPAIDFVTWNEVKEISTKKEERAGFYQTLLSRENKLCLKSSMVVYFKPPKLKRASGVTDPTLWQCISGEEQSLCA